MRATMGFQYDLLRLESGEMKVTLSGSIDEHSALAELFSRLQGDTHFDMRGIERINSIGVREWILKINAFTATHRAVMSGLSYTMVTQANCIANIFGKAEIRSCMAPYFCPGCGTNTLIEVTGDEIRRAQGVPPTPRCPSCASSLEFDELDSYFSFMLRG